MVKPGRQGRIFEVGDVYERPLGRTVLAADNVWFTLNTAKITSPPRPSGAGRWWTRHSPVPQARASSSRENVGVVRLRTTGVKQDGTEVIAFERTLLVYGRNHAPR